jgi:type 1 glutamine amidotransferase
MKIARCAMMSLLSVVVAGTFCGAAAAAEEKLKVLIIDGQNNHDWRKTTPILKDFLEKTGRFTVEVATTPTDGKAPKEDWDKFRPEFTKYDVVLSNYNGQPWPEEVNKAFVDYVSNGGGVVIVHAANNAFSGWKEYNEMIGLGWRGADFGERVYYNDEGKEVRAPKGEGPGAGHGPMHEFAVIIRDAEHPVTKGMPKTWKHANDELYQGQRGPAANMKILATAFAATDKSGTGVHEPMIWWIPFGKGKVFTTVMGHADQSMTCTGFQSTVARGCEWVATDKVTLPLPENFPTADQVKTAK